MTRRKKSCGFQDVLGDFKKTIKEQSNYIKKMDVCMLDLIKRIKRAGLWCSGNMIKC